ncbi:hypothetical protein Pryu01_02859 [Paraliobacillus ryukyuensis]|uniref:Uncharacterized protein n=1 Tax=Paraliobacillus ryukyuensis TaxID=200904 RepID=A0A366E6S3_9BACI|nr:hypothetical protein [Paraliobacillus ryukyuensis]RBO98073.1 hypothetical protein DES48_10695 [Paraliobacillus ryukyuensis]
MARLALNYTTDMEKAMQENHGVGFAEYEKSLAKRLEIEKKREKSYRNGLKIVTDMEQKVHR